MTLSEDARTLWQTAKALALKSQAVSLQTTVLPPLLFFTDPQRTPDPRLTALALPVGAAVIYRHFGAPEAELMARDLRQLTRERGLVLLVGQDEALAEAIEADGLHLPERLLHLVPDIRHRHPSWLITGAVHTDQSFVAAQALDAAIVSPVFKAGGASSHKADLGLDRFTDMCARAPCPVYGLGGITAERAPLMLNTGACGIAGVDAIQAAFKPQGWTRT